LIWGRSPTERFVVLVEIGGEMYPMPKFGTVESAVRWMCQYDPDGTVRMEIKDTWEDRIMTVEEISQAANATPPQMIKKKIEEPKGDWKDEGF